MTLLSDVMKQPGDAMLSTRRSTVSILKGIARVQPCSGRASMIGRGLDGSTDKARSSGDAPARKEL